MLDWLVFVCVCVCVCVLSLSLSLSLCVFGVRGLVAGLGKALNESMP